ncbi:hypothetical protein ACWD1Z_36865 [Streptomyces sp. NPDC002784]
MRVILRAHAVAHHGRLPWPPLALVTDLLTQRTATTGGNLPVPTQRGPES